MCGRFGNNQQQQELEAYFNASFYSDEVRERYDPNYDVRPSTDVLIITSEMPQNIQMAHWGFIGKVFNPKTKNTTEKLFINARGETVDEKRNFKGPWQNGQRCFFIMDCFYEWMATSEGKVPFAIQLKSGQPFAVGGIFKNQEIDGHERQVASLLTTEGNQLLKLIHNQGNSKYRMPVILPETNWQHWLNPEYPSQKAKSLLQPFPDDALQAYPVNKQLTEPIPAEFAEMEKLEKASKEYGFDLLEV